jgi:hypothetical protein
MNIIDMDFKDNYEKNIEWILGEKNKLNGSRNIDPTLASVWIDSQKTQLKRNVARFFIKNTTYVTFDEYFEAIGILIFNNYERITEKAENIIVCSGKSNKSQYMTSVIALHFIKKFGFREPDIYVSSITLCNVKDPILIFDDMSYTGSQMGDIFKKLYTKKFQYQFQPTQEESIEELPKIKLLLYGVNKNSLTRLTSFDVTFQVNVTGMLNKKKFNTIQKKSLTTESPFEVISFKVFKTLREVDNDMCNLVNYFFAPFLLGAPYLSVYFDHKIADDVSTFMKVLQYGPIIPESYSINKYDELQKNFQAKDDGFVLDLEGEKSDEVDTTLSNLVLKYGEQDPINNTDQKITFKPFLNGCKYDDNFHNFFEKVLYEEFLYPESEKGRYAVVDLQRDRIFNFVHDDKNKCLKSFYKQTRGGSVKNKKRNLTRKENIKRKSKYRKTKRQIYKKK